MRRGNPHGGDRPRPGRNTACLTLNRSRAHPHDPAHPARGPPPPTLPPPPPAPPANPPHRPEATIAQEEKPRRFAEARRAITAPPEHCRALGTLIAARLAEWIGELNPVGSYQRWLAR